MFDINLRASTYFPQIIPRTARPPVPQMTTENFLLEVAFKLEAVKKEQDSEDEFKRKFDLVSFISQSISEELHLFFSRLIRRNTQENLSRTLLPSWC